MLLGLLVVPALAQTETNTPRPVFFSTATAAPGTLAASTVTPVATWTQAPLDENGCPEGGVPADEVSVQYQLQCPLCLEEIQAHPTYSLPTSIIPTVVLATATPTRTPAPSDTPGPTFTPLFTYTPATSVPVATSTGVPGSWVWDEDVYQQTPVGVIYWDSVNWAIGSGGDSGIGYDGPPGVNVPADWWLLIDLYDDGIATPSVRQNANITGFTIGGRSCCTYGLQDFKLNGTQVGAGIFMQNTSYSATFVPPLYVEEGYAFLDVRDYRQNSYGFDTRIDYIRFDYESVGAAPVTPTPYLSPTPYPTATPVPSLTPWAYVDCGNPDNSQAGLGSVPVAGFDPYSVLVRKDCFTIDPVDVTVLGYHLKFDGFRFCIEWYRWPAVSLIGITLPLSLFFVWPLSWLMRKFWTF